MAVYIIQFSGKVGGGAAYYCGFAKTAKACQARLDQHRAGIGAKICRSASLEYGYTLEIAIVIPAGTRQLERRIKNMKSHRRVLQRLQRGKFNFISGDLD